MMGILIGCSDDDDTQYTQGEWVRMSDMDGVGRSMACAFTIDQKGYICCGYRGANKALLKDCWAYDINGNYWTQCADMPDEAQGRQSATAFTVNGKGYVTTGAIKDEPSYLDDTWEYDPITDKWTQMDNFPGGKRMGAIGFSIGNYGYVGTGYNDNYLKDFYRFDPTAPSGSQWEITSGFGGYKRRFASVFVINDVAYICLGENNGSTTEDFWKFDGSSWTKLRDISNSNSDEDYDDDYAIMRYQAVAFEIDGVGYIATGYKGAATADYWRYDPYSDLWYGDADDDFTPLTEANQGGSSRYGAVAFSNGVRAFVLSGASGSYYFDDVYEFKPYEIHETD